MKVIHISYSSFIGGASIAAKRIHQSLIKNGFKSEMWVLESLFEDKTIKEIYNKYYKYIIRFRRFLTWPLTKTFRSKTLSHLNSISLLPSKLVAKINQSDADVINLHWVQRELLSIKDISRIKKPIVWTLHDMWAFCGSEHYTIHNRWRKGYHYNNKPSSDFGFDLNRWIWERKNNCWKNPIQIITPSKWLGDCVSQSALMKDWPISVIPNTLNTKIYKPLDKKIACKKFKLPQDVPLILFASMGGAKIPIKGYDLFLKCLKILKKNTKLDNIQIVVLGENKSNNQTLCDFPVHYLGYLYDSRILQAAYNAVDLLIVPSRIDNFPNTALESQSCGTPVVSFNIGGLPDIIEHKKTGYLAKSFQIEELAKGVLWVLENSKEKKLGKNSREKILNNFSEEKISNDYFNVYKNTIRNFKKIL